MYTRIPGSVQWGREFGPCLVSCRAPFPSSKCWADQINIFLLELRMDEAKLFFASQCCCCTYMKTYLVDHLGVFLKLFTIPEFCSSNKSYLVHLTFLSLLPLRNICTSSSWRLKLSGQLLPTFSRSPLGQSSSKKPIWPSSKDCSCFLSSSCQWEVPATL